MKDSLIYASSGILSRSGSRSGSRPPPPPPARRTSSISDPEAITLATLHVTGCSTYEEVKTLRKRVGSEANLYASFNSIADQPIYSNFATTCSTTPSTPIKTPATAPCQSECSVTATAVATAGDSGLEASVSSDHRLMAEGSKDESLPPPPPEAFGQAPASINSVRSSTGHRMTYNRITNVHREFLQTLNETLANSPQQRLSPRLTKRRSLSVGEHEWDSDSGIIPGSTGSSCSATSSINSNNSAQTMSLQQSLFRLMGASSRPSSASSSIYSRFRLTSQSPHVPRKMYTPLSLVSDDQTTSYQASPPTASSSRSGSWPSSEAAANAASLTPRHSAINLNTSNPISKDT